MRRGTWGAPHSEALINAKYWLHRADESVLAFLRDDMLSLTPAGTVLIHHHPSPRLRYVLEIGRVSLVYFYLAYTERIIIQGINTPVAITDEVLGNSLRLMSEFHQLVAA